MDKEFTGLSSVIDLDHRTIEMLEKYHRPVDFINTYDSDIEKYITKARIRKIRSAAEKAPEPGMEGTALDIELGSFLRILNIIMRRKRISLRLLRISLIQESRS